MEMKWYHFPFERLTEYAQALEAVAIFTAFFFVVYVLVSLYYWSWSDMFTVRKEPLRRDPSWRQTTFTEETTITFNNLDLDNKKRKRNHKGVRHSDASKSDKDLT